ncbi:MAG: hypothetical protein ACK4TG_09680, partial [Thermaurantiacus sp.]
MVSAYGPAAVRTDQNQIVLTALQLGDSWTNPGDPRTFTVTGVVTNVFGRVIAVNVVDSDGGTAVIPSVLQPDAAAPGRPVVPTFDFPAVTTSNRLVRTETGSTGRDGRIGRTGGG